MLSTGSKPYILVQIPEGIADLYMQSFRRVRSRGTEVALQKPTGSRSPLGADARLPSGTLPRTQTWHGPQLREEAELSDISSECLLGAEIGSFTTEGTHCAAVRV